MQFNILKRFQPRKMVDEARPMELSRDRFELLQVAFSGRGDRDVRFSTAVLKPPMPKSPTPLSRSSTDLKQIGETIFIEWRKEPVKRNVEISESIKAQLDSRREEVCRLLFRDTADADSESCVLNCAGYVAYDYSTFGLVFRMPGGSTKKTTTLKQEHAPAWRYSWHLR